MRNVTCIALSLILMCGVVTASAESEYPKHLGGGFVDHGPATRASTARGIVATTNGQDENVVLAWLYDVSGTYAMLMINVKTGESRTFPTPPGPRLVLYASILASNNKYYTQCNGYFIEFDPEKPGFTYVHKTGAGSAMWMTEDDRGRIWAAMHPHNGLVSYNPRTGELHDYGHIRDQGWEQFQRSMASDDTGWIYFGVGSVKAHIIGFNPQTGKSKMMLPEDARLPHTRGIVYRAVDGKVYGWTGDGHRYFWFQFYNGKTTQLDSKPRAEKKQYIADHQGLFHRLFPDGSRIVRLDLTERVLVVKDADTGRTKRVEFDYPSQGGTIMSIARAPDGTVVGASTFPTRFFSYDPDSDRWVRHSAYHQWNTLARAEDRLFVGAYNEGSLLVWDPSQAWVDTEKGNPDSNPRLLAKALPTIARPSDLKLVADGRLVVMAGTSHTTGGGLMFWDRQTEQATIIEDEQLLENHSAMSLVPLGDGKLLVGSTILVGSGGVVKAEQAELYILDIATKKVLWREPVIPGATSYRDMILADNGLVYGYTDKQSQVFFVFDLDSRRLVRQASTEQRLGKTSNQQGSRIFIEGDNGTIFVLFHQGIAAVNPHTHKIEMLSSDPPVKIMLGGAYLNGRIYFGTYSGPRAGHLFSWEASAP